MAAEFDVEATLAKIPLPDKIKLLSGVGWWNTHAVPAAGLQSLRMSDGPNGVRGSQFFNGVPSSCFPSSTGLGSSFDVDLALRVGEALGVESHAKGCHVLLAPTVNTQRSPLGGRSFESFAEDPHLNGTIAAAYINGLQSKGVAATIKHFVANDQEFQRYIRSLLACERALREIYLKPFQIAIKNSNPWALMTAYNRVNGLHVSENPRLLVDILRGEWGYQGTIISDWIGVYSTAESIKAGLDIEMPGPTVMRGKAVERLMIAEKLFTSDIDERVRKILVLYKHALDSGVPFDAPEGSIDTPELRQLLRTAAADATVLLKNDKQILPLKTGIKKIAVIGPNAKRAMTSGGGSAQLRSTYAVTPFEGITAAANEIGAEVTYHIGTPSHNTLPLLDGSIRQGNGEPGAYMQFWNESPSEDFLSTSPHLHAKISEHVWDVPTHSTNCFLADGVDDTKVNEVCYIRYTTKFTPDETGSWELGLSVAGAGNLFVDSKLLIDLSTDPEQGESFFGLGTVEKREVIDLEAGKTYDFEIRISNASFVSRGSPFSCRGGIRLGGCRKSGGARDIEEASKLAAESDVAILVIGLNHDWESEGFDRQNIDLPRLTNNLVAAVLKANPKTVIVNQTGAPVAMPWADSASTILQAFYGGNELGNGLADVLFGKVNPSGKLSLTFPKRLEDSPSFPSYGDRGQELGKILYNEGIFVGYRGFEIRKLEPLFAFGHGLSYTTFEYSGLQTSAIPAGNDPKFAVTFTIKNTGSVSGREVAQVYIADPQSSLPRPLKELKGFNKVALEAGESKVVSVELDREALSFYDDRRAAWVAEAGKFDVFVGASSTDIKLRGEVELEKSFTWKGL
ncbi:glycoside hydrolase family 3 protein [Pleurotus ostreatus PC15]|uniref:beta-glucosidase n=1 Tax=Pleurotus ostreatus (strain PC15) TaxID=1137138 RepID=A0A067NRB1_PLEO1|nr:glycoside hydrolase family 3 protein [Pleurotus ostreatus PC15]